MQDRTRDIGDWVQRQRLAAIRRRHEFDETKRAEQRRRQEADGNAGDEAFALAGALVLTAQAEDLRTRIDHYDAATVAALQENEQHLRAAQVRLEALLDRAFVLPDGRRVFRTEDGTQVFDEHGNEVTRDDLDPAEIPDHYPSWETYETQLEEARRLEEERQDLLDYQQRLDEARDRLDEGGLSEEDIEEIESDLSDRMPAAVRDELRDSDPAQEAQSAAPSVLEGQANPRGWTHPISP